MDKRTLSKLVDLAPLPGDWIHYDECPTVPAVGVGRIESTFQDERYAYVGLTTVFVVRDVSGETIELERDEFWVDAGASMAQRARDKARREAAAEVRTFIRELQGVA